MTDIRREGTESLVIIASGCYFLDFLKDYTDLYFKNYFAQMLVTTMITLVVMFVIHLVFYTVNWYNSIRLNENLSSFHDGLFGPSEEFKKVNKFKMFILGAIVAVISFVCEVLDYGIITDYMILLIISSFLGFFTFTDLKKGDEK
jgi:hypothetical protein